MAGDFSDCLGPHGGFCACPACTGTAVPAPFLPTVTLPDYVWVGGCANCGAPWGRHYVGCASLATGIELNPKVKLCWLCTRCDKMNAPHVDQCPCGPDTFALR